ncbi:hypothetical protein I7Z51_002400 [Vibrio parahaemolyticus]|uniref:hypothetical protein n=1 Tax=Vibrio TaxID=662 RepID=UPI001A8F678F|nr:MULTISPECIES: hypothetical protein [Vibrio]EGQ7973478.1 hypothetical protein [Vibrio parahaemolyticus]MBO0208620.1 hypothetical protein [Vibrio sp. Vb0877]MCR9810917.1 hypothetical protein [Vibrio parahaemolyticus]
MVLTLLGLNISSAIADEWMNAGDKVVCYESTKYSQFYWEFVVGKDTLTLNIPYKSKTTVYELDSAELLTVLNDDKGSGKIKFDLYDESDPNMKRYFQLSADFTKSQSLENHLVEAAIFSAGHSMYVDTFARCQYFPKS